MDLEFSAAKCVQTSKNITGCFVRLKKKTSRDLNEKKGRPKTTQKKKKVAQRIIKLCREE